MNGLIVQWGVIMDKITTGWSDNDIIFSDLGLLNYTTTKYSILLNNLAVSGDDKVEMHVVTNSITKNLFTVRRYVYANARGLYWFTVGY